jgi:hypothetical protein
MVLQTMRRLAQNHSTPEIGFFLYWSSNDLGKAIE